MLTHPETYRTQEYIRTLLLSSNRFGANFRALKNRVYRLIFEKYASTPLNCMRPRVNTLDIPMCKSRIPVISKVLCRPKVNNKNCSFFNFYCFCFRGYNSENWCVKTSIPGLVPCRASNHDVRSNVIRRNSTNLRRTSCQ